MIMRSTFESLDLRLAAAVLAAGLLLTGCGEGEATRDGVPVTAASAPAAGTVAPPRPVLKPEPEAPDHPRKAKGITAKPGFMVELLYTVPKQTQGSWVALCTGPDGTFFATDQYKNNQNQALYQIKPPAVDDKEGKTVVTPHPVKLEGAQGVCYAFGSLYVMESGGGNGLMRLKDTDNDGLYDDKELLLNMSGGGEHGTHAIVPTADGKGLYLVAGNMSPLPKIEKSRPVKGLWGEDHVLPQNPDGRGHARGLKAPGGWILRVDPDGKDATLICAGFRNQYDIGVHPNGEVFAYDADMEWDLGQPWYRPTRINHAVSGAEFGWRNGSGKWPAYYEDSLPAVVDIGPGSPVGVTFGTGAGFPTKYQEALYALDWTFGTIYAIHLEEDGASYKGELEPFVMGKPLPVTDVAIGDDGHMYFTAGGRRGNSHFYRVSYYGVNDKAKPAVKPLNKAAQLRKKLEAFHTPDAPAEALGFIWKSLGHSDRYIRFAARVALEHQPTERWATQANREKDPLTRIVAGIALARHKHEGALPVLLRANLKGANETTFLAWTRGLAVAMARGAKLTNGQRAKILDTLGTFADSKSINIKTEVVRLRVALDDPTVVGYAIDLMTSVTNTTPPAWIELAAQNDQYGAAIKAMRDNPPPTFQIGIAFMLRNVKEGWTEATRQAYFGWLNLAAQSGGGNSFRPALMKIREQAVATLTPEMKIKLGSLIDEPTIKPKHKTVQPKGPGRKWRVNNATVRQVEMRLARKGRNYDRGGGLYQAALCSQCHVMNDYGGDIGPNLTGAVTKFSLEDLLRATIEPSHEVNDQYAFSTVTTKDGKQIIGRIVDKTDAGLKIQPNPREDKFEIVPNNQVAKVELSKVSPMPAGLVDSMSVEELTDLVAYIMAKGEKDNELFKK